MKIDKDKLDLGFITELFDGFGSYSTSQFGEDLVIFKYFSNKVAKGFYVDAGAFHPKRYSNTYLLWRYLGWSGVNVDGNPAVIAAFNKERPDDINVCAALSSEERDLEFVVYQGAAHSTLDEKRKNVNANIAVKEKRTVRTQRLSDVIAKAAAGREVDFLNVDLEGSDLDVLQSFDFGAQKPSMVCVEDHDFLSVLRSGGRSQTYEFMRSVGYNLVFHSAVSSIYTR